MAQARIHSFPPVAGTSPALLVLGSMPSVASLRAGQYYGNPRNHFWRLMADVLGEPVAPEAYEDRLAMLARHGVALWDALESCVRPGSLDAAIADARPNDVAGFLRTHPTIRAIACNGRAAQAGLARQPEVDPSIRRILLPSSSPVPTRATRSYADRLAAWLVLRDVLAV